MSNPVLTYYDVSPRVVAFSTTRHGGVSTGNYASFNINAYCGDAPDHITANRRSLATLLGIPEQHIIMPHQTHGTTICRIDAPPTATIEATDALMTHVPGLCIGVSTADCIPIIIYDPEHHAASAVHAGWRGTVQRIACETVRAMQHEYQSDPSQLRAIIGPGISLESFEVGDEVYDQFAAAGFDMPLISRKYAKWHLDLWTCNRLQLQQMGLCPNHITVDGTCTYQHANLYFSARRLGINSGRIFTGILLQDDSYGHF